MADKTVHSDSVEIAYLPVYAEHPINGPIDISSLAVEVSLPVDGNPPTLWVSSAWEAGTKKIDGVRYYVVGANLGTDFSLTDGTVYQPWVRVTLSGSDKSLVKINGRIVADDT